MDDKLSAVVCVGLLVKNTKGEEINTFYMKYLPFYLILLMVTIGCTTKGKNAHSPQDSIIVFFNVNEYSRGEISKYIDKIDSLGAKLICVNVLFDSLKDVVSDSLLATSIKNSNKVILASYISKETDQLIRSHSNFTRNAKTEGVISYLVDEKGFIVSHIPLFQDSGMQMISYPNEIAFAYRVTDNNRITKFDINNEVGIEFSKDANDFVVLDDKNIKADLVKDKIILFGDLSSENCIIKVKGKNVNVHCEVVTANVILNILSEK